MNVSLVSVLNRRIIFGFFIIVIIIRLVIGLTQALNRARRILLRILDSCLTFTFLFFLILRWRELWYVLSLESGGLIGCDHDICGIWGRVSFKEGWRWPLQNCCRVKHRLGKRWLLTKGGFEVQKVVTLPETVFKYTIWLRQWVALWHWMVRWVIDRAHSTNNLRWLLVLYV